MMQEANLSAVATKNKTKVGATKIGALFVFTMVLLIWFVSWLLIDKFVASTNLTIATNEAARGVFGDKFGAVNALFSGLAFAGIIWTLMLQRVDLSLQRDEIEATKTELAVQNQTLRRQRFESTLFQLIALHTDIVDKLVIKSHSGRDAFSYFIELLKLHGPEFRVFHALRKLSLAERYELRSNKEIPATALPKLDTDEQAALLEDISNNLDFINYFDKKDVAYHEALINSAYAIAHEKSRDGLSHYFRNLYNILKFIDESNEVTSTEKTAYARIVRAQLSDEELAALFYNCIVLMDPDKNLELGFPKMTRLANKYNLLQNLNMHNLIHDTHEDVWQKRVGSPECAQ